MKVIMTTARDMPEHLTAQFYAHLQKLGWTVEQIKCLRQHGSVERTDKDLGGQVITRIETITEEEEADETGASSE